MSDTAEADTTTPLGFYLLAECENCEEEIFYGPCVSLLDHHRGLPVITFDMAAQSVFRCENCGASNYTGDFELHCEGGDDSDGHDAGEDEDDE